jgi:hypothetical protein
MPMMKRQDGQDMIAMMARMMGGAVLSGYRRQVH